MNHEQAYSRPVLLRQAREAAGLHIAALAAALKVPVKKLEALEAGRYEELPDLTFARALASSACRQLKIDPAPVLEQIPAGHQPALGDTSSTINAPFKGSHGGRPSSSPAEWLRKPAVLVSLALVMGAAGLLLLPDWDTSVNAMKETVSDLNGAAVSADAATPNSAAVVQEVTLPAPGAASSQPAVAETVQSAVAVALTPPPGAVAGAATPSGSLLHIQATADAWVEVVDGAGKSQVQRMLKSGDALDFSATPPYSVVVGRADAVAVTVRGQAFDVMPYARNSVARFQVK